MHVSEDTQVPSDWISHFLNDLAGARNLIKMSCVKPFTFNAAELRIVTINGKTWTQAREATKAAQVIKAHVSPENYAHKWQLIKVSAASTSINWAKDLRKR